MKTTIDKLLNGRFAFEQPARGHGYRVSVDTLLLAAAVQATGQQKVLELGCGVGAAMLALATREANLQITGLELQEELTKLCASNIELNSFEGRMTVIQGDVAGLLESFYGAYDHVMMNPPFHKEKHHTTSPNQIKAIANTENDETDLPVWIQSACTALKAGGQMTLIHKADRQDEITTHAARLFEKVIIKPIISKTGAPPKRIIVRTTKGEGVDAPPKEKGSIKTLPPFILYGDDARYSEAADTIMRDAGAMLF